MTADRALVLLTSSASPRAVQAIASANYERVIAEDPASIEKLRQAGTIECVLAAGLTPGVRDMYHADVRKQTAQILNGLREALQADRWTCSGVPLWDTILPPFHWWCLDSLFQAADTAAALVEQLSPNRIVVSDAQSHLARAVIAIGIARGIPVECLGAAPSRAARAWRARSIPYLALVRDCVRYSRRRSGAAARPSFVCINHALRNFRVIEPVLRELQHRVSPSGVLVVQTGADGAEAVRAAGLPLEALEGYVSLTAGTRALASIRGIVGHLTSGAWRPAVAAARLRWNDIPLETLAHPEISFDLARLLGNAAREIACAQQMLARERPKVVVMTEDRSSGNRAIGFSAQAAHVPALLVQWGPIAENVAWTPRVAADVAAVEGEAAGQVLRASDGGEALEIVVTGQPKYDQLLEQARRASRPTTCQEFGLDPARPIVLYATHPLREGSAPMRRNPAEERHLMDEVTAVVQAVEALDGVQLLIKPHPNEGTTFHRDLIESRGQRDLHFVSAALSVYPLLFACDLVVTHWSTVGMEGVLLGKPLVIVNFSGQIDPSPYVRDGAAVGAYQAGEVEPALRGALFDAATRARLEAARPAFLRRHVAQGPVTATERMVDLTLNMARTALSAA